ncbi:3-deoxy-D-manno-octulosonic-acid transferase [Halospina denitrificans]|uniref:3-deoxy-D-manno-octulosonic acid transferase n=1 Tax=Halospina denitrificans TaxID=332522 RepID=A0A4R7JY60_9GAMM|nr:lipid IV(A) 3-deoxy-D-manno-octulosonic acid transferase [Halospina denitrificans]TDT43440.1 3-deoxy-D-manno-octulosonic-acid transferase [Halospina denitrificans]
MGRWLYSLCLYLALPCALAFLGYRSLREPGYRSNLRQRFGHVKPDGEEPIWVHAVSVGEVLAAAPMVRRLMARFPERPVLITTVTPTGADRVRDLFGEEVAHRYVPYDLPHMVNRFLSRVQPSILVIMETEVWPNLVHACDDRGIPVILANARLSEKSATGYSRFAPLALPPFQKLDWIAAQAEADAERFVSLGARPERVTVTGSIKYDVRIGNQARAAAAGLRELIGGERPVWIAASTHDGEEGLVLDAHCRLLEQYPEALLVLVPRHPERFDAVARLVADRGLVTARRASGDDPAGAQVYLADTMGELPMLFGCAQAAFMGGSLIARGGHNPLEAAAWSLPVLSGPHVFNFSSVYQQLSTEGGMSFVIGRDDLARELGYFFGHPQVRRVAGTRAGAVMDANQGALDQLYEGVCWRLAGSFV